MKIAKVVMLEVDSCFGIFVDSEFYRSKITPENEHLVRIMSFEDIEDLNNPTFYLMRKKTNGVSKFYLINEESHSQIKSKFLASFDLDHVNFRVIIAPPKLMLGGAKTNEILEKMREENNEVYFVIDKDDEENIDQDAIIILHEELSLKTGYLEKIMSY